MLRFTMAQETLWSDLRQRTLDAMFDSQFPENGSFVKRSIKGRSYFYYVGYNTTSGGEVAAKQYSKYVGPADDEAIVAAVAAFGRIKTSYKERRDIVRALTSMGLPAPPALAGNLVEALWKAGLFRVRAVLVGTAAFQTYAGTMGVRFPTAPTMTGDLDFAQFRSVSMAVDDTTSPILEILRSVDASFAAVAHPIHRTKTMSYANAADFKVDFLSPNRGSNEHAFEPFKLPPLGGTAAHPMRFLDFLIKDPQRSVLLHKAGVPVSVPSPERFCVHKLIVSGRRPDASVDKARKDLMQSALLLEAAKETGVLADFGHAYIEAWSRGPSWRDDLSDAERRLPITASQALKAAREEAFIERSEDPVGCERAISQRVALNAAVAPSEKHRELPDSNERGGPEE